MTNGHIVAQFEKEFAAYVGAKYAIACANGTVTLQAALVALGVGTGDTVAVPPLTMAATTIAVLNVGAVPRFVDVQDNTWLMLPPYEPCAIGVSLYGLHYPALWQQAGPLIDDAAQTLRPHGHSAFTSYSFQASKILQTGEGGMLVTNDERLASLARSYLSLGYDLRADQPRIDPAAIKRPDYVRHVRSGINGRMNDVTAELGLERLERADEYKLARRLAAGFYEDVVAGVDWITPQYVPEGWVHDWWSFSIACDTPERALWLQDEVVKHGGERPYAAWLTTYLEPAFNHLAAPGTCPIAENLQPRLLQFQTNRIANAAKNATALERAICQSA